MQVHSCVQSRSISEEWVNCITHAFGAFLAIIGAYYLISHAIDLGGQTRILAACLYSGSAFLAMSSSALFHGTMTQPLRRKFRIIDHISIYLMIAGGYTPLLLVPIKDETGTIFCMAIWFLAMLGTLWKIFYFDVPESISTASYLFLGWLGVFAIEPLIATIPANGLLLILFGGLSYTVGAYFCMNDHKKYYHTIWHVLVLIGSLLHYMAVFKYVINIP